jgi:hypothetical protein
MKWGNCCILCLGASNSVILSSANAWKTRYSVPDTHCFADDTVAGYNNVHAGCMRACVDGNTKLIIFAHANENIVHIYKAHELAALLLKWGVTDVGLIAIKACEVGKGQYLETLKMHLANSGSVGWLVGYRDSTSTGGRYMLLHGEAREITTTWHDILWHFLGYKTADQYRVKVVQGNAPITVPLGSGKTRRPYHT